MEIARLVEQRIPLALGVCGFLAAVLGAIFLLPSVEQRVGTGLLLLAIVLIASEIDRRRRLDDLLEFRPSKKNRLSAQQLGAKVSAVARERFPDQEPPYIRREHYDGTLEDAIRSRRFVVVKGVTNSGKTRALYEAIGTVLPDHRVVMPKDPTEGDDALSELLGRRWLLRRRKRYVLIVNDLENRLSALQGFAVRKWLRSHPTSRIVATLSAEHWAQLLGAEQTPLARAATKLLDASEQVTFGGEFEGASLVAARNEYGLPKEQVYLGSYLVSVARAVANLDAAKAQGLGAASALALSGINCSRAGLFRPIDLEDLVEMAKRVTDFDGRHFSEDEWVNAIDYCVGKADGGGAILELAANEEQEGVHVVANPALVELIELRTLRKETRPNLPDQVWKAIVECVADGPFDRLRIASAASWRGKPDLASQLYDRVADEGGEPGHVASLRLKEPDRGDEPAWVTNLLERASIGPNPHLRKAVHIARPDSARPSGTIFDPTIPSHQRWHALYRRQIPRDFARFFTLLLCDVIAVWIGILGARQFGAVAFSGSTGFYVTLAAVAAGLVLVFFLLFRLYRADRERARLGEILKSTALAGVALSLWVIGKGHALIDLPVAALAIAGASGLAYTFRWTYDQISRAWVRRNSLESRVLLIASERPTAIAELILNGCRRPMQMVGYLSETTLQEPGQLGNRDMLEQVTADYEIGRVIIAESGLSPGERLPLIYQCQALDLITEVVPTSAELFQGASEALDDMVVPLVTVRPLYLNYVDKFLKRFLDLLIAIPLSALALMLLLPVGAAMKMRSRHEPVLTWDYRPGLGAILFPMWRLRIVRRGAATRGGRLFERLRINEIPQLLNVLEGNMSLVGPRPLSPEEFDQLDAFQRARCTVLPGITGLWQVARRKESSLDDMNGLDIVYCRKWTPLLDFTILLLTIPAVGAAPAITKL